jgi:hypothetical protein
MTVGTFNVELFSTPFFITGLGNGGKETFRRFVRSPCSCVQSLAYKTLRQKTGKRKMDVPKPMRPGDFYHERAREMLKRAEEAKTDDARASFLVLAGNWENLARQLERPSW